ncbi:hypothetical protein RJT34_12729 [Clitoria ternatea]|uniref:Uncharacterized protein n=1 Tax=Clitoria ternatea TaxID=43366 RepID=A0AAN9JMQ6_CLITE
MVVNAGRLAGRRRLALVGSVRGLRDSRRSTLSGERQIGEEIRPGPVGLIVEGSNHPHALGGVVGSGWASHCGKPEEMKGDGFFIN